MLLPKNARRIPGQYSTLCRGYPQVPQPPSTALPGLLEPNLELGYATGSPLGTDAGA